MSPDNPITNWCDTLSRALNNGNLPGVEGHRFMAPVPRQEAPLESAKVARTGSVLILLYPRHEDICLPLTRRSERVFHHRGQISLPGGIQEPGDDSLAGTALRETHEEIGVNPGHIYLLGALTPVHVTASNSKVQPFVGYCPGAPEFHPNDDEVAEILEMPLSFLLDPANRSEELRQIRGREIKVPFFRLGEHKIWGATAMILSEFAAILSATPELAHIPSHPAC